MKKSKSIKGKGKILDCVPPLKIKSKKSPSIFFDLNLPLNQKTEPTPFFMPQKTQRRQFVLYVYYGNLIIIYFFIFLMFILVCEEEIVWISEEN